MLTGCDSLVGRGALLSVGGDGRDVEAGAFGRGRG